MVVSAAQGAAIAQAVIGLVGAANFSPWEELEEPWRERIQAAIAPEQAVAGVVFPKTADELAAVVAYAHHQKFPLLPCGNGSKLSWGGLLKAAQPNTPVLVVSTAQMHHLIDHAVGDLTVTVEAGMPFATLQGILAQAGQTLAIDPTFPAQATIGGIVATADTGSLRQRYNGVRDMLLGIAFVRADGQMAKAGGRVVKNVAGYDLMKLLTGSYGTLGILTQMTLRVYPLPDASQTVVLVGPPEAIAQFSQTLLQSVLTPVSLDLVSASVMQHLGLGNQVGVIVRFQSIAASVTAQINQAIAIAQSLQLTPTTVADAAETSLWQRLQERMSRSTTSGAIACKIGIQPSQAMALLQINPLSLPGWYAQIHAGSGLGRIFVTGDAPPTALQQVRTICQANNGFLSVLEAPLTLKQQLEVWGDAGNALEVMRQLKQKFDPHSLLSPRRFVGGI